MLVYKLTVSWITLSILLFNILSKQVDCFYNIAHAVIVGRDKL